MSTRRGTCAGAALAVCALALLWRLGALDAPARSSPRAHAETDVAAGEAAEAPARATPGADERGSAGAARAAVEADREVATASVVVLDDSDERPIAGASVAALVALLADDAVPVTRTSDSDGRCALPVPASAERVRVRVEAPGYAHSSFELAPGAEEENVAFLCRSSSLRGRILAADTLQPVAGARLELEHADGCAPTTSESDAEGRYELPELAAGERTRLFVSADGFARHEFEFDAPPASAAEEQLEEQDVRLARGLPARGRVTDWESGAAVAGASVAGLETDAHGRFEGRIARFPGTTFGIVTIAAQGYVPLVHHADLALGAELEYRLLRTWTVEGTVTDDAGRPLRGASVESEWVRAEGPSGWPADWPRDWQAPLDTPRVVVGASGAFRFEALPWHDAKVSAGADGFEGALAVVPGAPPGGARGVALALRPRRDPDGHVFGTVRLGGAYSPSLRGTVAWRGSTRGGETRFEGNFALDVEPGEVELTLALDDPPGLERVTRTVRVAAGERVSLPLEVPCPPAAIAGRVRFDDGTPAAGAHVSAAARADENHPLQYGARADELGSFELVVPRLAEPFLVRASLHFEQVERPAAAGARGLELELARTRPVLVRVAEAATGAWLDTDYLSLYARAPDGAFRRVRTTGERELAGWSEMWLTGRAADLLLVPSMARIATCAPLLVRGVDLCAPEPPRLELCLEAGLELDLELDPRSEPWDDEVSLQLLEPPLWEELEREPSWSPDGAGHLAWRRRIEFDERGAARLGGLAPGEHRFRAPRGVRVDPEVVLVERGAPPVRVRWWRER